MKKTNFLIFLLILLIATFTISACSKKSDVENEDTEITDVVEPEENDETKKEEDPKVTDEKTSDDEQKNGTAEDSNISTVELSEVENMILNAPADQLMFMLNSPTDDEMASVNVLDNLIIDDVGSGADRMLLVASQDNVEFAIDRVSWEEETGFTPEETLYSGIMKKGDAVYMEAMIPEGIPSIAFSIYSPPYQATDLLAYDGVNGTQKYYTFMGIEVE